MSSFYLKILASNKVFFSGKADILVVPGLDGEIAIMAHHQNMAIATTIGDVRFKPEGSEEYVDAVVGIGFVYIANNRVTMIVDTAERPEDIDEVRAKAAMERAKEQLRQKQSIQEYHVSQASLARAVYRYRQVGKHDIN